MFDNSELLYEVIFLVPNWKWATVLVFLILAFVARKLCPSLFFYIKNTYGKYHKIPSLLADWLKQDIHEPLTWLVVAGIWQLGLEIVGLQETVYKPFSLIIRLTVLLNLLRLAYLGVDALGLFIKDSLKTSKSNLNSQLTPFATKLLKVFVVTLGLLLSLQSLGFNVGAILAGLGIGSLALALAAQDTAANLFGSVTVILDRPFQIGDYIKVGGTEGTVEDVGFRSTQIRTPDKSIVTVPNSLMAKERIDNLGVRPSRRISQTIGVMPTSSPESLEEFVGAIRSLMEKTSLLIREETYVYIQSWDDFSLKVSINGFIDTTNYRMECEIREKLLLDILALAKERRIECATKFHAVLSPPTER